FENCLNTCSNKDKIILLMDYHESHCSYEAVKYAKENGIVLIKFPPHCTHRLQPLDVNILNPFKFKMKISMNDWMAMNAGKTIKIHDLAHLTKEQFIQSFNQLAFTDEDFAASYVTDHLDPEQVISAPSTHENSDTFVEQLQRLSTSLSPTLHTESDSHVQDKITTSEDIRHFPKAGPRVKQRRGRKKGNEKTSKPSCNKKSFDEVLEKSSDDSDDNTNTDLDGISFSDFVLVKYITVKSTTFFVGCVKDFDDINYEISFFKKKTGGTFVYPELDDVDQIPHSDIELLLPKVTGNTKRSKGVLVFPKISFENYNMG
ncbi:hypothetical protein AGLY_002035, partial [Aphis glycines]